MTLGKNNIIEDGKNNCNCLCGEDCEECLSLVIDDKGRSEILCDCDTGLCVCLIIMTRKE